jgi:hypothetical protein
MLTICLFGAVIAIFVAWMCGYSAGVNDEHHGRIEAKYWIKK